MILKKVMFDLKASFLTYNVNLHFVHYYECGDNEYSINFNKKKKLLLHRKLVLNK